MAELKELAKRIRDSRTFKAMVGFDGFVDEIVHVVGIRHDAKNYERITDMADYARRIQSGCGLSTNMELITVHEKLGGNGPIFANAMIEQGAQITYIGCVGKQAIHPVFSNMEEKGCVIAIADPGKTDAYEFSDGKVIVSKLSSLNQMNWQGILDEIGLEGIQNLLDQSDLISMNNWTMLPYMSEIWENVLVSAVPGMKTKPQTKTMFFDLADPEKRNPEDILDALKLIGKFTEKGFTTILGLNKKEACEIAELFGMSVSDYRQQELRELAEKVYKEVQVSCLVVHPVECACSVDTDGYHWASGPYCERPVITTGAGDHFNAGYMMGVMNGYTQEECLQRGVFTSGYYVRKGDSPLPEELADFMETY